LRVLLLCIVRLFATKTRHHSCLLVAFCQQDAAKLLIAHGADVDKMTLPGDNQTPVYIAAKMGYVSMLEVLMLSGASMTAGAGTNCATTPFYAACSLDHFEAAKFLADNGARTALTDEEVPNSFEELQQLCENGKQSIVESVVKLNPQLLHTKEMVALERMLKAVSKAEPVAGSILQCLKRAKIGQRAAKLVSKRQPKIVKTLVREGVIQSNDASNEAMETLIKQEEAEVIAKKAKQDSTAEKKRRAKKQKQKNKQRLKQEKVILATNGAVDLAAQAAANIPMQSPVAAEVTVVTMETTPTKTSVRIADAVTKVQTPCTGNDEAKQTATDSGLTVNKMPPNTTVLAGATVSKVKTTDKTARKKEIERAQTKKEQQLSEKAPPLIHEQLSQSLRIDKPRQVVMAGPLQKASAGKTLQTCTEVQQDARWTAPLVSGRRECLHLLARLVQKSTEPSDFVDATQATKALVAACTLAGASVGGCCTISLSSISYVNTSCIHIQPEASIDAAIDKGADPIQPCPRNRMSSALHVACSFGRLRSVTHLVKKHHVPVDFQVRTIAHRKDIVVFMMLSYITSLVSK
jgi:hypothetical protein